MILSDLQARLRPRSARSGVAENRSGIVETRFVQVGLVLMGRPLGAS